MRLQNIILLYRVRLRTRLVQELFAIVGIAAGVALLFSSQIASTSLSGSVQRIVNDLVGNMQFEVAARSPAGFDERLLGEVLRLPGVRAAVPALDRRVTVIGPRGRVPVDLLSSDAHFARSGGPLMRHFTASQLEHEASFALPLPVARSIGLSALQSAEIAIGARRVRSFLGAVLLESEIGDMVDTPIAIAPILYGQRLTRMQGHLTSIFVGAYPGRDREVRAELERLVDGRLNVRPADAYAALFGEAAAPANQSAALFAGISALVGFLFAFNAMLLTVPQRRSLVEDLRLDGYTTRMIAEVLLFDAAVLGVVATLLGLALGDALSLAFVHANPDYLSFAFTLSSQRIIVWQSVLLAAGGGAVAACVGVLVPLAGSVFPRRRSRGRRRSGHRHWRGVGAAAAGIACLLVTVAVAGLAPQDETLGVVSLVVAALLLLRALLEGAPLVLERMRVAVAGAAFSLAIIELRSRANQPRLLAIAATGAIAVLGSVAIKGAEADLQHGLDGATRDLNRITDVWVTPADRSDVFTNITFQPTSAGALAHLPGVRKVSIYRGGFIDFAKRRIWVLGPPRDASQPLPPSQMVQGDLHRATAEFRGHGWAAISKVLAAELGLRIGQSVTLPSPDPTTFRISALITNLGWSPGAVIVNADDYARAWGSRAISAYNVAVEPGASPTRVRGEIQRALGGHTALTVETVPQREALQRAASRQGLSRLTQIATLVLIAAILAMAAAMGATIWQRRPRLADMKVDGFGRHVLWRALLIESALLLGTGCSVGALCGIYGQILLSRMLATVTGFPVEPSIDVGVAAGGFVLVTSVAVLIVAVPGYLAARVRPAIILQD
jgi:putative ABC transport system permease protein